MENYGAASAGNRALQKALMQLALGMDYMPVTTGNVYYVIPSGDSNYVEFYNKYQKTYRDGTKAVQTTVAAAYAAMTSNRHDVMLISANAAHAQTAILSVAKNRCHFIGLGLRMGAFGLGARARITMGVTTAAADIAVMQNTGVGNTFRNLKFDSSNTKDESLYAFAEGGEYSIFESCEFYKSTDLNETAAAEVLNNGDSAQWLNCVIGSTANEIADDKIRPCMLLNRETLTGKVCRDNVMDGCLLLRKAAGTEACFIYGSGATDVERMFYIDNTLFFSNPLGAATPALGVSFGAAQTVGAVVLGSRCSSVDVTALGETGKGVYTLAPSSPTYATAGKAVAS